MKISNGEFYKAFADALRWAALKALLNNSSRIRDCLVSSATNKPYYSEYIVQFVFLFQLCMRRFEECAATPAAADQIGPMIQGGGVLGSTLEGLQGKGHPVGILMIALRASRNVAFNIG